MVLARVHYAQKESTRYSTVSNALPSPWLCTHRHDRHSPADVESATRSVLVNMMLTHLQRRRPHHEGAYSFAMTPTYFGRHLLHVYRGFVFRGQNSTPCVRSIHGSRTELHWAPCVPSFIIRDRTQNHAYAAFIFTTDTRHHVNRAFIFQDDSEHHVHYRFIFLG